MIIDDHVHVGMEVDGTMSCKKMWTTRFKRDPSRPTGVINWRTGKWVDERTYDTIGMRYFFVNAGRWDEKYLDPSTIPPYTVDDLIYIMDDAGVDKSVIMGRDYQNMFPPFDRMIADADHVANMVDKYPDRLVGTAPVNPHEANFASRVKYFIEDLHLKGLAEVYCPTGIDPDDREKMYPIYEACVEYDCTIFVHIGTGGLVSRQGVEGARTGRPVPAGNYPYGSPRYLEQVGLDFPDLRLMQHIPRDPFRGTDKSIVTRLVKKFPNFHTHGAYNPKTVTGEQEQSSKEWLLWCQENIPDQVHMGSDHLWGFPIKQVVKWVQNMTGLTDEFKKKLFETNPRKFYKF